MSDKIQITKADLKTPDRFLQLMNKSVDFISKNIKMIATLVVVVFMLGGGIAVYGVVKSQTENKILEKYYMVEKKYLDQKKKAVAGAEYSESMKELSDLAEANPSSQGGQMAALLLSDLYRESSKLDLALATLNKVTPRSQPKTLLSALVLKMKGNVQADLGQCDAAISSWKQIVESSAYDFMDQDLKVKMGLCYEKNNDIANAEKMYQEASLVTTDEGTGALSKEAAKYLRILKSKKEVGGT